MARGVYFSPTAWVEFQAWFDDDAILSKITSLIDECRREPFKGTGKPEPLNPINEKYWSRRIDQKHRLVYGVTSDYILVARCRGHYGDK